MKENHQDAVLKGRHSSWHKGIRIGRKLTLETAQRIREGYAAGYTTRELAHQYKVSQALVSYIINNKIWRVPDILPSQHASMPAC